MGKDGIIFENQFKFDYENMIQFARFIQRKTLLIVAFIGIVVGVFSFYRGSMVAGIIFMVFVVVAILLFIITPIANVKKQINYMHQMGKYPVTITSKFMGDEVVSTNTQSVAKTRVNYDNIVGLKELKTIYVIVCKNPETGKKAVSSYVTVEKNGFTKGTPEGFVMFINNKIAENKAREENLAA